MTAYTDLIAFQRETEALSEIAGRLSWDRETLMPAGAAEQRSEEIAALEGVLHARRTDPRIPGWLAEAQAADDAGRRMLALVARAHRRSACVPARLATEIARVTSRAQGILAEARAREDVASFLPVLAQVVALRREEGQALSAGGFGADAYDALLDEHEPGMDAARVAAMFERMRARLVALREALLSAHWQPQPLAGRFPQAQQLALARELADAFGYDWNRGRLDLTVHPFCSGSGQDVRITTRVVETEPFNCLYSTIHETGHALYEQGIDPAYRLSPLGHGVSSAVHESQSRICENQIGRSRAFTGWLFGRLQAHHGALGLPDADAFHGAVNRVQPGYIRTESDEVHYNLHVMLRFDLERRLVAGTLDVRDLEAAWNERFAADFGVPVDRPSHGVLQDVHWSIGLFGYFPTYTLGNVYAACLWQAMQRAVPGLEQRLAAGDARPAAAWLREHLQRHGSLLPADALVRQACGFELDEGPLLDYLDAKFRAIYRLD